jgi:transcriptional regulator with XRE-family HTH domain
LETAVRQGSRGRRGSELAERAEFSVKYAQAIERGDENLSLRSLCRRAALLGVRTADLFEAPKRTTPRPPGRPRRGAPRA